MLFRIFYLDDEPDLCEMFKDIYESDWVSILTFNKPEEAIREIQRNPPHLILLDYRLPETTGDKIAIRLQTSIPIALLSGDLILEPQYKFVKLFYKPFNLDEMKEFIESYEIPYRTS